MSLWSRSLTLLVSPLLTFVMAFLGQSALAEDWPG